MKTTLVIALIAATAILGCDGSSNPHSTSGWSPFDMNNDEAALAALWLSGELTPPPQLYETIADDLAAIRSAFADSTTMASIRFQSKWALSQVVAGLNDTGVRRLRNGEFEEFDALGVCFGVTRVDTSSLSWRHAGVVLITFSGHKHPERLADAYGELDDVTYAGPNHRAGDWSCVYPWRIDGGMSYLVRYGWGDCPAGCIRSIFWYFRVIDDEVEFVGRFENWFDPEPDWWDEAKAAYYTYRGFQE